MGSVRVQVEKCKDLEARGCSKTWPRIQVGTDDSGGETRRLKVRAHEVTCNSSCPRLR